MTEENNILTDRQMRIMSRYAAIRQVLVGLLALSVVNIVLALVLPSPKMYSIGLDNRLVELKYDLLRDRIRSLRSIIDGVSYRDVYVYRSLFSADTTRMDGVDVPYPASKYEYLQGDQYSSMLTATWMEIDALARHTYAESVSLDQLQVLAKNKENMSQAIPAIWPVDRTRLEAFYGFGIRTRHPIYGTRAMHQGVDMALKKGNDVYATGDATVACVENGQRRIGYGRQILLDHEFGYKTRYAHLSQILVKPGERVTRGQVIGKVGNTGGSTGPHLHYEVLYMGRNVNPVNYFNKNMTSDEYRELIENSKSMAELER